MNELQQYPRPSVTVDCVVFGYDGNAISVLLINRKEAPFKNMWTLPGGFLFLEETAEESAQRILKKKPG
ncbi:NUDIX domain-containing protein [Ferruginibacter sp.]